MVKQAAVLIGLFERPGGELEVLLTTRAKTMRRQPSQTVGLSLCSSYETEMIA